uniref:Uncharacterized protein n=1 Tax=Strongyloides venezuelensis TaxID=75913 RepID=A0A0K0F347_STRVS
MITIKFVMPSVSLDSAGKIKRDELLNEMETKLDKMKKIQILKDKFKDISPDMEMGNYKQYVLMKPFVELGIKKNLRDVKALVSQIEEILLPYLTQDFDQSKRSKRSTNFSQRSIISPFSKISYNKSKPIEKPKNIIYLPKVTPNGSKGKQNHPKSPPPFSPNYV